MKTDTEQGEVRTENGYLDRYVALRNEVLGQLKLILSARRIVFYEKSEDGDLERLLDLPAFSYADKYNHTRYFHITCLFLDNSGEIRALGLDDEDFYEMEIGEGTISMYTLCHMIDMIHKGQFIEQ